MFEIWGIVFRPVRGEFRSETGGTFLVQTVTNAAVMPHFVPRDFPLPSNDNAMVAA